MTNDIIILIKKSGVSYEEKRKKVYTKTEIPVTETQIKKLTKVISEAFYQRDAEYTNQQKQRERNKLISEETRDF